MACCQEKLGKPPCNRCDSGHTCGGPPQFQPSQLSHYNPTATLANTARPNGAVGTTLKVGTALWAARIISVPIAFGLSYQRNKSLWYGFWQGLVFPWLYLGYRGVEVATKKKGEKK